MSDAAKPLAGKVAIVTGGARGIGRGFSERLALLGAKVGVHGMREESPGEFAELENFKSGKVATTLTATAAQIGEIHGVETLRLQADLTQVDQVKRIMQETLDKWGRIDILVNNAGGDIAAAYGKPDPNDGVFIKDEDVRAVLDRNLYSCILCCQHAGRVMIAGEDGGRIINLSSVDSFKVADDGARAIYSTAKAGINHYTRMLAQQMRKHNITVNCIAPGATKSGRWLEYSIRGNNNTRSDFMTAERGTLERAASVDEVARVVEFLATDLGAFVSGEVIKVDGGMAKL